MEFGHVVNAPCDCAVLQVDMYAGALFIQQALHWDLYIAVAGLLAITAVYTVSGACWGHTCTDPTPDPATDLPSQLRHSSVQGQVG